MNCPSCNTMCLVEANFCHNCGISIQDYKTNSRIPAYNVFTQTNSSLADALKRLMPASYVEKLLASDGRYEGERRVVTMLFSDIKGSTSLGEYLDPEEVMQIMNSAFDVLIKPIMRYEGTLARLMGDAILAFFGAPIAHEDDPQRACRAALDIIKGANEFSKTLKKEKGIEGFSVRVGINTGLVVVAEVGADLRVEYTAMGDAVNVASRMESAAEPGTILITEDTMKLLPESFEVQSVGSLKVKGRTNAVSTFRLISEKNSGNIQGIKKYKSPLIGRKIELDNLTESLKELERGKGKIIAVSGECGAGKTRLIAEAQAVNSSRVSWIESKALAYRQNNSYWLIKNLLKSHLVNHNGLTSGHIKRKLKREAGEKFSEIFTFIGYLLEMDTEERLSDCDLKDAESLKGRIHYAVKEYFKYLTRDKAVVLVLEDLQWCDTVSLELITELFSLVSENRLLIIMTYRKNHGEIHSIHSGGINFYKKQFIEITLNSLGESESKELVKALAGKLSLPELLEAEIVKRTEGNPFFIEELLKFFIEKEIYLKPAESYEHELNTPNLLRGVIMARIDCLNQLDKMVLQSASVIGRVFQKKLLVCILENSLSEKEIDNSLTELLNRELITAEVSGNFIPFSVDACENYSFKQSLIQEVAYNSLLISNREKIHLLSAEAIEMLYPDEKNSIADSLGVHFEKGKCYNKAVCYYKIAADNAKSLFANKEAIHFYKKILSISKLTSVSNSLLFEIHESLGDVNFLTSQYLTAIEEYEKALDLSESPLKRGIIYQKCGQVYERWGEYDKSLKSYNASIHSNKNCKSKMFKARVFIGIGMVHYREGRFDESILFSLKALELIKKHTNSLELSEVYNNIGLVFAKLEDLSKAEENLLRSLEIRECIQSSSGLSSSYNNLGFLYRLKGDNENSLKYYLKSLEFCEKTGNKHGFAKTCDNLSDLCITMGESEKAIEYNLKAMEILGKITLSGSDVNQHLWLQSGVW